MPRDSAGNYTLPPSNPVVDGTTIEADGWANPTLGDIATALTNSLSRNGNGGMLVPLTFVDGSVGAPGIAWTSQTSLGFYRAAASDMRVAVGGADKTRWVAAGLQTLRGSPEAWTRVASEKWFGSDEADEAQIKYGADVVLTSNANGSRSIGAAGSGIHYVQANDGSEGLIYKAAGAELGLRNTEPGMQVLVQGRNDADDTDNNIFAGDPEGDAIMYNAGVPRIYARDDGGRVDGTVFQAIGGGNVLTQFKAIGSLGGVGFQSRVGGNLHIRQLDAAGADESAWITAARDGVVTFFSAGTDVLRTELEASRASNNSGAQVKDASNDWLPVGYNLMPFVSVGNSGRVLGSIDISRYIRVNNTSAATITVSPSLAVGATIPVGAVGTADVNLTQGAGVTMRWLTGAGVVTGNRVMAAGSVATLTWITDTDVDVWGSGLS